jgi:hypothetical protein
MKAITMDTSNLKLRGQSIREFYSYFVTPLYWDLFCKNKTNKILNSRNKDSRPNPENNGEPIANTVLFKSVFMATLDGITESSAAFELW